MTRIIQTLEKYEDFRCMKGISQEDISAAETKLKVTFAKDYKDFLAHCGVAKCNKHEVIGLGSSERLNVIAITELERSFNKGVPSNWYVIEEIGVDGIVVWQAEDGKVYQTDPKHGQIQLAESLLDYIQK